MRREDRYMRREDRYMKREDRYMIKEREGVHKEGRTVTEGRGKGNRYMKKKNGDLSRNDY